MPLLKLIELFQFYWQDLVRVAIVVTPIYICFFAYMMTTLNNFVRENLTKKLQTFLFNKFKRDFAEEVNENQHALFQANDHVFEDFEELFDGKMKYD